MHVLCSQHLGQRGSLEIRALNSCSLCQPPVQRQVSPCFQFHWQKGLQAEIARCPPLSYVNDNILITVLAAPYVYMDPLHG